MVKALTKIGFQVIRRRNSHVFLRHPDRRTTVVPVRKGEVIGRELLLKIIRDARLSKDEFMKIVETI